MELKDKRIAEAVLKRLCQGAQIDGIRFGPVLQILITDHSSTQAPIRGQIHLNLASSWALFESLPNPLPDHEDDLPDVPVEQQLQTICGIRELMITDIQLGETQPHLLLRLEDGRTLLVNGRHDMYECWQLGVAMGNPQERWMVVATPGGGVAVWAPDSFGYTE